MSSSINQHYTFQYVQPDQYHFSHDSVFFARRVFEELQGLDLSGARALDICAGSGVVGLDFLFHRRQAGQSMPWIFDFLDVQLDYLPFFEENARRFTLATKNEIPCAMKSAEPVLGPRADTEISFHFINRNYEDLQLPEFSKAYDLIVSAPPYFLTHQGKLSPNEFKNRCRFFIDSDLRQLILSIAAALRPGGVCFILLRDLSEHKWDMPAEAQKIAKPFMNMRVLGNVLGTHLVRFELLPGV